MVIKRYSFKKSGCKDIYCSLYLPPLICLIICVSCADSSHPSSDWQTLLRTIRSAAPPDTLNLHLRLTSDTGIFYSGTMPINFYIFLHNKRPSPVMIQYPIGAMQIVIIKGNKIIHPYPVIFYYQEALVESLIPPEDYVRNSVLSPYLTQSTQITFAERGRFCAYAFMKFNLSVSSRQNTYIDVHRQFYIISNPFCFSVL